MLGQVIINGIFLGGLYFLVSIGLTLIFGVMKIINFAHGEFLMLAMYATFWVFHFWGIDPYPATIIVVPVMFILGMVAYRLIIQPVIDAPELAQVFVTLGLSISLQGLALFLWHADFRAVRPTYLSHLIKVGPLFMTLPRFMSFWVALATIVLLFFFLKRTYIGKAIRASAQNRIAAQLMGVDLKKIYMVSFGIGIAIVGLAGTVFMTIYEVFPSIGGFFVLVTFVVVVLGGMGSLLGALVGGLVIGLVEAISGFFLAPALKEVTYFILFVIILIFKPTGIFGKKA